MDRRIVEDDRTPLMRFLNAGEPDEINVSWWATLTVVFIVGPSVLMTDGVWRPTVIVLFAPLVAYRAVRGWTLRRRGRQGCADGRRTNS